MSLKQEIESWVQALAHYDHNEFNEALMCFEPISDTSKILFNCGVIHATIGQHDKAVAFYQRAVALDQYLAIAYFQQGVSNFLVGDFEEALANFNDTLLYLRGNTYINYEQLGLSFKLYSCEVLFNRGLCYIYLQQKKAGLLDFSYAVKEKMVETHNVIDDAIRDEAEGYTVFSIPVGVLYRPTNAKVKNLKTKDYLGKARLIAAANNSNPYARGEQVATRANISRDDRFVENISYAATNMIKPGLQSRSRQQSEPPINRNMFPPTPPPEAEKPSSSSSSSVMMGGEVMRDTVPLVTRRVDSVRSTGARLEQLEQVARNKFLEKPRLGTVRTASEPRAHARTFSGGPGREIPAHVGRDSSLRRHITSDGEIDEDAVPELYSRYHTVRSPPTVRGTRSRSRRPPSIEEEEEAGSDSHGSSSFEDRGSGAVPQGLRRLRGSSRAPSRQPEIRKIRVKVHLDEIRYIMINTETTFEELVDKVREKFGLRKRFKCKMQDEGDMVTMGDQDDLDMAISNAKAVAKQQRADMGKIEIWVHKMDKPL
ncbi:hypothetical protein L228DRAFT_134802 [Xylona heveae TC161]|uniref:PB1 domain-containing protein n=1 Tax=Xylona heveae (strain CBS 132557 / TC161) TaxID=1328760 RepID=A0A165GXT4_XYLHT|nr:hypothetical protein L228DRAFT_134802 [Xylona heveae TC161]KZF22736.1 hypothetical protein L228DRAFT_134802 [Xylona heveae TC161]